MQFNRCQKSNVIFLSSNENINDERYEEKKMLIIGGAREDALKKTYIVDKRRFNQFSELTMNWDYIDFGTGLFGVLICSSLLQKVFMASS